MDGLQGLLISGMPIRHSDVDGHPLRLCTSDVQTREVQRERSSDRILPSLLGIVLSRVGKAGPTLRHRSVLLPCQRSCRPIHRVRNRACRRSLHAYQFPIPALAIDHSPLTICHHERGRCWPFSRIARLLIAMIVRPTTRSSSMTAWIALPSSSCVRSPGPLI